MSVTATDDNGMAVAATLEQALQFVEDGRQDLFHVSRTSRIQNRMASHLMYRLDT